MPSNNVNVFGECTAGQVAIGQGANPGALSSSSIFVTVAMSLEVPDIATGFVSFGPLPFKVRIISADITKIGTGFAGNTVLIGNGVTAITDAIATGVASGAQSWAGSLDVAQSTIPAGSSIRATVVRAGGSSQCRVNLVCIKVL